jgi:hypothetical protein
MKDAATNFHLFDNVTVYLAALNDLIITSSTGTTTMTMIRIQRHSIRIDQLLRKSPSDTTLTSSRHP